MDLGFLEEGFLRRFYDLVLTAREPGRRKFSHRKLIGYQHLELRNSKSQLRVLSPFEALQDAPGTKRRASRELKSLPTLISNQLWLRKQWIESFDAWGIEPSELLKNRP